MFEEMCFL